MDKPPTATVSASTTSTIPGTAISNGCFGFCRRCGTTHSLGEGNGRHHARALMAELGTNADSYSVSPPPKAHWSDADTRDARGQMMGVLECRDHDGKVVVLKAFSALLDGQREAPGWVPPVVTTETFQSVVIPVEHEIKTLTAQLQELGSGRREYNAVLRRRAIRSRELLDTIHTLSRLHNFRGEERTVVEAWSGNTRMPGGVGGCCAPKLLNDAARHGLVPLGLVEFYWGVTSRNGKRVHGQFYPCCREKCQPILGFMLCGVNDER